MKSLVLLLVLLTISTSYAQDAYEPNAQYPYRRPHPDAPEQIKDWQELIGICDCISEARNPDQSWAKPQKMTWVIQIHYEWEWSSGPNHKGRWKQFW